MMTSHRNGSKEFMRWQHQAPAAAPSRANLTNRLIDEHEVAYLLGLVVSTLRRWRWSTVRM